jgi:hypothetical protein
MDRFWPSILMMIILCFVFQVIFAIGEIGIVVYIIQNKKEDGEIYQSIEKLDKQGMSLIEEHNVK